MKATERDVRVKEASFDVYADSFKCSRGTNVLQWMPTSHWVQIEYGWSLPIAGPELNVMANRARRLDGSSDCRN